jgi:hypothetical protein
LPDARQLNKFGFFSREELAKKMACEPKLICINLCGKYNYGEIDFAG